MSSSVDPQRLARCDIGFTWKGWVFWSSSILFYISFSYWLLLKEDYCIQGWLRISINEARWNGSSWVINSKRSKKSQIFWYTFEFSWARNWLIYFPESWFVLTNQPFEVWILQWCSFEWSTSHHHKEKTNSCCKDISFLAAIRFPKSPICYFWWIIPKTMKFYDIYSSDPFPVYITSFSPWIYLEELPKSQILTPKSDPISKFSVFMSPWITFLLWIYWRPNVLKSKKLTFNELAE